MGEPKTRTEVDAAFEHAAKLPAPQLIDITGERKVLLVPHGLSAMGLKPLLAPYDTHPERRQGTAILEDLDSLVLFANRFKDADSVLYASSAVAGGEPSLTAVIDYHKKGEDQVGDASLARYGEHRGIYTFPLSEEWEAWTCKHGEEMNQTDFAEFIESRVADLDTTPTGDALHFAERTMLAFASPSRIVELSRGLTVRSDSRVKNQVNLSSGESQFVYETSHVGDEHGPLKVPGAFLIAVPVFRSGELYQLAVRLRYRLRQGNVTWILELYQHQKRLEMAFDEACERAAEQTGMPLLYGVPEAK